MDRSLSRMRFTSNTEHVATQLALAPLGTRVATYWGEVQEVPLGYECQECALDDHLKFWVKTINHPVSQSPRPVPACDSLWRSLLTAMGRGTALNDPRQP